MSRSPLPRATYGLVAVAILVACGGGGGGGGNSGGNPPTNPPATTAPPGPTPCPSGYTGTAPNCVAPQSTTTASGTVVDDGTGAPLAGVPVKLEPWAPCGATPAPTSITPENDGCPTPLPSPQATTGTNGTFTLGSVPNGHYLLVVGTDAVATLPPGYAPSTCTNACGSPTPAPFTVQATVHDNVTLTGGNQTLVAPTLKPIPTVTPPVWETNGDYRLATLNATTEMPCYLAWQYERQQNGLALGTNDEWLVENMRAIQLARYGGGLPVMPVTTQYTLTSGESADSGGVSCTDFVDGFFPGGITPSSYSTDPRTEWFGGQYVYASGLGLAEFPIDPRSYTDPNVPNWP